MTGPVELLLPFFSILRICDSFVFNLCGVQPLDRLVAFQYTFITTWYLCRKGSFTLSLLFGVRFLHLSGSFTISQQLFDSVLQRCDFFFLSTNLILQLKDYSIFFPHLVQKLFLVSFQKLNLFDKSGKCSLILIILNLFLIFPDPLFIIFKSLLYLNHMIFIRIDKLCLLALQHCVNFILKIISKVIHRLYRLLNIAQVHLN